MKISTLFIALALVGIVSCKKKDINENEIPSSQELVQTPFFPLKVGAIWVYDTYKIDSVGNAVSLGFMDTIQITDDTLINNNLYFKYESRLSNNVKTVQLLRDSCGFIVNDLGTIVYNFKDYSSNTYSLEIMPQWNFTTQLVDLTSTPITVPAGSFQTMDFQKRYFETDGDPIDQCGNLYYVSHNNFGMHVGKIRTSISYLSEVVSCQSRETRLIYYQIPE